MTDTHHQRPGSCSRSPLRDRRSRRRRLRHRHGRERRAPQHGKGGHYKLTFAPAFATNAPPAVVLTAASGEQTQVRINPEDTHDEAYRTGSAWADAFRLDFPAKGDKNPVARANAPFYAIAAAAGGAGPWRCSCRGMRPPKCWWSPG